MDGGEQLFVLTTTSFEELIYVYIQFQLIVKSSFWEFYGLPTGEDDTKALSEVWLVYVSC